MSVLPAPNLVARPPDVRALDVSRRLLAFNWLTAGYAHRDWLGPWGALLEPRESASLRLLRRVSLVLLDRHRLRDRYVRDLGEHGWLLHSHDALQGVAGDLGIAMLGGWVRRRLERPEVAAQIKVLGAAGRQRALEAAQTLRALPGGQADCRAPMGWPVPIQGSGGVIQLGLSCLAALLDDSSTGARERFTLRFSAGMVMPLTLASAQRDEALALIHGAPDRTATS